MEIEPLVSLDQIKVGDGLLMVSKSNELTVATALEVKASEYDGTEVIFDIELNKYFNVGFYLEGTSWAKDIRVVRLTSNACGEPGHD